MIICFMESCVERYKAYESSAKKKREKERKIKIKEKEKEVVPGEKALQSLEWK